MSVFLRDGDRVFHTYSAYARGAANIGFHQQLPRPDRKLGRKQREEPAGRASEVGAGVLRLNLPEAIGHDGCRARAVPWPADVAARAAAGREAG